MLFCTSIECMDGRVQEPLSRYLRDRAGARYVDTITEPGPCRLLADARCRRMRQSILDRVGISVHQHGSRLIAVSGHHDCAGNPVTEETQLDQIRRSMRFLQGCFPDLDVIGLWVDASWTVHPVDPG